MHSFKVFRLLHSMGVAGLALLGAGCTFSRVEFRYSSRTYAKPEDAMILVDFTPEDLAMKLCDGFRMQGAMIVERTHINQSIASNPECIKCWEADREIALAEFKTYQANDFRTYKNLDRKGIFEKHGVKPGCNLYLRPVEPDLEDGIYLVVDLNQRSRSLTLPTYDTFFSYQTRYSSLGVNVTGGGGNVGIDLKSRLKFWIWKKKGETHSHVYAECRPVSGGVEALPGNSIGYAWWRATTGEEESRLERHYLLLIEELNYHKKQESASSSNTKKSPLSGA